MVKKVVRFVIMIGIGIVIEGVESADCSGEVCHRCLTSRRLRSPRPAQDGWKQEV